MKRRTSLFLSSILVLSLLLSACGTAEKSNDDTQDSANTSTVDTENSEDTEDTTEDTVQETEPDGAITSEQVEGTYTSWQEAYLDFINNHTDSYDSSSTLNLIYLDSDEAPELVFEDASEASGELILSFHEENLYKQQLERIGSTFKETV